MQNNNHCYLNDVRIPFPIQQCLDQFPLEMTHTEMSGHS